MNFTVENYQFFLTFCPGRIALRQFMRFVTKIVQFKILDVFLLNGVSDSANFSGFPVENPKS